ncbi:MAG: hypothetical protein CK425_04170 [Parachlamydia sp.]|nr:MAG: hypothetical protein CK425_04170 [Parachlamydia sp.]
MKSIFLGFFLAIFFSAFGALSNGHANEPAGTLIVTYQTGLKGERLERVRFWVCKKNSNEKQLYPAANTCVEDVGKLSRTVVIENLTPGDYVLEFVIPNRDAFFVLPSKREFTVHAGGTVKINQVIKPRYASLKVGVELNDQQKKFSKNPLITLHGVEGEIIGYSAEGELVADTLSPGQYTLIFENLPGYTCPVPMEISVKPDETVGPLKGVYQCDKKCFKDLSHQAEEKAGGTVLLFYGSNAKEVLNQVKFRLKTQDEAVVRPEDLQAGMHYQMKNGVLAILRNLPVGRYAIEFYLEDSDLPQKVLSKQIFDLKLDEVKSIKLHFPQEEIASFQAALQAYNQEIIPDKSEIAFVMNPKGLQPAFLSVQSNKPNAPWSLYRRSMLIYAGNGSVDRLKVPPGGPYVIKPERKEGYELRILPKSTFNLEPSSSLKIEIYYEKQEKEQEPLAEAFSRNADSIQSLDEDDPGTVIPHLAWILVEGGETILGDPDQGIKDNERSAKLINVNPFEIATYAVTNAECALWLNAAYKNQKITYTATGEAKGEVRDLAGHLLLKTMEADPLSQIFIIELSENKPTFMCIADKCHHPVINISWYGAMAFCEFYHFRLPTEAEWENAAGMSLAKTDGKRQKFRYGFSQNEIDPTWANYKSTDKPITSEKVLTTEVGFFNGHTKRMVDGKEVLTHDAKSPVGAYDMSGNVWEWVSNDDLIPQKIVKGGCYDSLAEGVRVAERLALEPEHVDAYTGFRAARTVVAAPKTTASTPKPAAFKSSSNFK